MQLQKASCLLKMVTRMSCAFCVVTPKPCAMSCANGRKDSVREALAVLTANANCALESPGREIEAWSGSRGRIRLKGDPGKRFGRANRCAVLYRVLA